MTALVPRLFGDIADWFESDFPLHPSNLSSHLIRVEDERTEQAYKLRAELPGVDPDKDIQVSVDDGLITINAERREVVDIHGRSEFRYGILRRSVRLPANSDREHITASYDKGVLEVNVPLTAPEPTGPKIPVTAG
jgi:HSP20 family molecular chaperone IbpA